VPKYVDIPGEIMNRLGLARLLARVSQNGPRIHRDLWNIAAGRRRIQADEIPKLAKQFGVFPLLLWEFLFPGMTQQVTVRSDPERNDWTTMESILLRFTLQEAAGVAYEIPRRTLACSDIAISRLRLAKGLHCENNHHPGTELLLPLRGRATVKFGPRGNERPVCQVTAHHEMAHYLSGRPHIVANDSDEEAEMLVIRLYGETP
jgi:uncharacterized RmlC-like cupin family protein